MVFNCLCSNLCKFIVLKFNYRGNGHGLIVENAISMLKYNGLRNGMCIGHLAINSIFCVGKNFTIRIESCKFKFGSNPLCDRLNFFLSKLFHDQFSAYTADHDHQSVLFICIFKFRHFFINFKLIDQVVRSCFHQFYF